MANDNYIKLEDLFVGNIDAEKESLRKDFTRLFYNQNDEYKKLISGDKFLIIGRKGTGKTYLAKYINTQIKALRNNYCKMCDSNAFNLQSLIDLRGRDLIKGESESFWKWIILLQFSYALLDSHKFKSRIPFSKLNKLRKFIKNKYPDESSPFRTSSFSKKNSTTSRIEAGYNDSKFNLSKKNDITVNYENKNYYDNLNYLYNLVIKILNKKNTKSITLILDDLDCLNSLSKLDNFLVDLLTSLITVTRKLNLELTANQHNKNSKIIIVLREDILNYMHDYNGNLNKIASDDDYVRLYWLTNSTNEPFNHPLMKLILGKIKASTPTYSTLSNKQLYDKLFRKDVRGKNVLKFLLDNSFGRPRDIIQFLNIIKSKYKNSAWFHPNYFKECMQLYSNWFYDELRNEISIRSNSQFLKESIILIKNIHKINFSFSDVENTYNAKPELYPNITNLSDVITEAYSLGVIGTTYTPQVSNPNIPPKHHVSFAYRTDSDDVPDFSKGFVVHEGLRKKFSLY